MMRLCKRVLWPESVFHGALIAWFILLFYMLNAQQNFLKPTVGHKMESSEQWVRF